MTRIPKKRYLGRQTADPNALKRKKTKTKTNQERDRMKMEEERKKKLVPHANFIIIIMISLSRREPPPLHAPESAVALHGFPFHLFGHHVAAGPIPQRLLHHPG